MRCAPVAAARNTRSAAEDECVKPQCSECNLDLGTLASLTLIQAALRMSQGRRSPDLGETRHRIVVGGQQVDLLLIELAQVILDRRNSSSVSASNRR
jgi:hypothetical protein